MNVVWSVVSIGNVLETVSFVRSRPASNTTIYTSVIICHLLVISAISAHPATRLTWLGLFSGGGVEWGGVEWGIVEWSGVRWSGGGVGWGGVGWRGVGWSGVG